MTKTVRITFYAGVCATGDAAEISHVPLRELQALPGQQIVCGSADTAGSYRTPQA